MRADPGTLPEGLDASPELLREARAAYAAPGRAYHGVAHLDAVLTRHAEVAGTVGWRQPHETWLALLFHDAVYVAGRHDSEARSAALARVAIAAHVRSPVDPERVAALIELTARHGKLAASDVDADAALFLDCDMAVLGGSPDEFAAYDRGVASEYAAVPAELYAAGRKAFLARLLASERIFLSDFYHASLDAPARRNLRHALATL